MEIEALSRTAQELLQTCLPNLDSVTVNPLPPDGSTRQYFRISTLGSTCLLCQQGDIEQNRRYIELTELFSPSLDVPSVLGSHPNGTCYLVEDLGEARLDKVLAGASASERDKILTDASLMQANFSKLAGSLAHKAGRKIRLLDQEALRAFLSYFQSDFLELFKLSAAFTPEAMRQAESILDHCASLSRRGYVTGDFQPRNLFLKGGRFYVIDFQDGYYGCGLYDMASLLFSGSGSITIEALRKLAEKMEGDGELGRANELTCGLLSFAILRRLRSFGTYGKLGIREGKKEYAQKIPEALMQLEELCRWGAEYFPADALASFARSVREPATALIGITAAT